MLNDQALSVKLYHGELKSISSLQMLNGGNTALVAAPGGGWEILQYLNAEETEPDQWRLTGLLRGQCGTEQEARTPGQAGAAFILLDDAVAPAELKAYETGLELTWRVGASGEDFSDQHFSVTTRVGGLRALQPLEPVHVKSQTDSTGDMHVSWIRRGRIDADNWLAPDIPLGEDREAYRIEIRRDGGMVRSVDCDQTNWTYSVADRLADFGDVQAEIDFSVAMISAAVGPGRATRIAFPLK
ncbi:GTA baseplate fiber-binding domain-containing protein [Phyllobacterium lublinensis]|uniref:GTA baseplate fiber-binding domain-containing protein n=1 Tax=Phyllobacterium lublinensis TaxID=2875708 RepID=UPI004026959F